MSKVLVLTALLHKLGWGDHPGEPLDRELQRAVSGAITRSENCRERRVVLELQRLAGGPRGAAAAVASVLRLAGAGGRVGRQVDRPESLCIPYLESQRHLADPLAPAALLGTSTWRVTDAVRVLNALATDAYGRAVSRRVVALMERPKRRSRESPPGDFTAPLNWGAGIALRNFHPAYKAGWGGSEQNAFLAGQVVLIPLHNGQALSLAVMFHPHVQPAIDDPGLTNAPQALKRVMRPVAQAIVRARSPRR